MTTIQDLSDRFHSLYLAIRLLENDQQTISVAWLKFQKQPIIKETARKEQIRLEKAFNEKTETILTDAKYAFIKGALKETYQVAPGQKVKTGHDADSLLTHKWLGFPILSFLYVGYVPGHFYSGKLPHGLD